MLSKLSLKNQKSRGVTAPLAPPMQLMCIVICKYVGMVRAMSGVKGHHLAASAIFEIIKLGSFYTPKTLSGFNMNNH